MPISFDIEHLRRQYKCKHYFETGMWDPVQTDISSWKAVESDFDTVHCIELRKDFVDKAEILFNHHIKDGKYFVYNDDSVNMYKYLNKHPFFNNEKTIASSIESILSQTYSNISILVLGLNGLG